MAAGGVRTFAPESRYGAASPHIGFGPIRLATENANAMNSLPGRIMEYPEATSEATPMRALRGTIREASRRSGASGSGGSGEAKR